MFGPDVCSIMAQFIVTGANRGIGLGLVRRLTARGENVVATTRSISAVPADITSSRGAGRVHWVALDAADPVSIEGFAARVAEAGVGAVDVLINNAGVSSQAKTLDQLTAAELHRVFAVNAFAPLLVAKALRPMLSAGSRKLIVNISSQLASITNNSGGSTYPYRASKAALNQLTVSMANELRGSGGSGGSGGGGEVSGFTCLAVHPGWVRTDMGGSQAPLSVEQSVTHLIELIDMAGPEHSGAFLNYDATPLPW